VSVLQTAREADAAILLALREAAARWQVRNGIVQWSPGEVGPDEITAQVAAGEWLVLRGQDAGGNSDRVRAACRLVWSDQAVCGEQPDDAGYVHGLVIDRAHAGAGLGRRLLDLVAERARGTGRPFLRLDCVEGNPRLRRYYREIGFREVGRREFDNGWGPSSSWNVSSGPRPFTRGTPEVGDLRGSSDVQCVRADRKVRRARPCRRGCTRCTR
jgi:ribosomal protein S18 acetylase RimI-like enzyme